MDIAIYSAGLPHAERTLDIKSLGGSETAALMVAKELAKLNHAVTLYTKFPARGEPDAVEPGHIGVDGVRYRPLEHYAQGVTSEPFDLLIVSRDPNALNLPHQARKAVLWLHDLATHGWNAVFQNIAWNVDELWTVSEFHRRQVNEVTDYPLTHIKALRNGIIAFPGPEITLERDPKLLYYGSRPERGLAFLVAPGGIMERMPEYRLQFSMYGKLEYLPEHVRPLYQQLFEWARRLPNVEFLGELTQREVRDKLRECAALVYPSDFEETSCILAREAISVQCPIIGCAVGALPETVDDAGALMPSPRTFNSPEQFIEAYTHFLRQTLESERDLREMRVAALQRDDLYWDQVARMMLAHGNRGKDRPLVASAMALVEVGDVIPAISLLKAGQRTPRADEYLKTLLDRYEPLMDPASAADAYAERYTAQPPTYGDLTGQPRFEAIVAYLAELNLKLGGVVIDFGCCEGNQLINLARRFPHISFVGYDHTAAPFAGAHAAMEQGLISNVRFTTDIHDAFKDGCNLLLMTEVLEHIPTPWATIDYVEGLCEAGTHVLSTTPIGPWEAIRLFSDAEEYRRPEHLWHLDKPAMEYMLGRKRGLRMTFIPFQMCQRTMLLLANLLCTWTVDKRRRARPIDSLRKAESSVPRIEFAAVAAIAHNDEHDILRMLKSCERQGIRDYVIALGPSTDATPHMLKYFLNKYPWCSVRVVNVPAIKAGEFGFDDARNAALDAVQDDYDWALWIDSDEELVGQSRMFLRNNHYDSYAIHQHHHSCDPRGAAPQIDRPSRLVRLDRGFRFTGKIHEHAERGGINQGPGHALVLPKLDIMHIGYKSEEVRQSRFWRNLPFLQWDRQVNPDRKLGKFLWLRDLIHQMRYAAAAGNTPGAQEFAREAIAFYDANWQDMLHFGNGLVQGFQYVSEARKFLGLGIEVAQQVRLASGSTFTLQGVITEPGELTKLIEHALKDECKRAQSRYH